jgi:NAD(P)H-dependent FMN reductase
MYNEPGIPSQIHSSSEYKYAHTRAWSELISSFQAFVFVTPQYNWGYPASVKNAIDYLFNEWKQKPAMVVSYGGHGGGKAAAQLQQVLQGLDMQVVKDFVGLKFPDRSFLFKAAKGQDLGLQTVQNEALSQTDVIKEENAMETMDKNAASGSGKGDKHEEGSWAKESKEICTLFEELVTLLHS